MEDLIGWVNYPQAVLLQALKIFIIFECANIIIEIITRRKITQTDLINALANQKNKKRSWDNHNKLYILTTEDALILSYKELKDSIPDHLEFKKLFKTIEHGDDKEWLEIENHPFIKQQRKLKNQIVKIEDNMVMYHTVGEFFLFEKLSTACENKTVINDENIIDLSKNFEQGYKITIGRINSIF